MKKSRWWLIGAVAALIAWTWWTFRPVATSIGPSAAANPTAQDATASLPSAVASDDAREVARNAGEQALDATATRALRLELLRFPDESPLATVQVEIAPTAGASASNWLVTDGTGHLDVEVSFGATALDVHAAGYEPREVQLERPVAQQRVLLTPASGLFGRVVGAEHAPIAGAQVRVEVSRRTVQIGRRLTRSESEVSAYGIRSIVANATTNSAGFYFLAYPTTTNAERVRVVATTGNLAGALDVELPRASMQLDDVSVSKQLALTIHVVDTNEAAVAGAALWGPETPRGSAEMHTGSDGTITLLAPMLPALLFASAPGMRQREQRIDGRVVERGTRIESLATRVEFVLESVPSLRVKVLDAQTRQPIFLANGRAMLLRNGKEEASTNFELDTHGEATVLLIGGGRDNAAANDFDVARLSVTANDYREHEPTDIDLHAPLSPTPIEILLEPEADTVVFHGRVVRGGEPVADLEVGVKVQRRSEGSQPHGWEYKRAVTDVAGRFVVRWPRTSVDQVVSAFPHKSRSDESGFIGPLDVDVALASEQVLELKPAVRVPAILRGVSKGGRYLYFVAIVDADVSVRTTVNGAPLTVDTDGEARVTLLLPSDRRSRVSIGFVTGSSLNDNFPNSREFDPAHPGPPLVFELQPFFADITGRAIGFTADETAHLSVVFVPSGDQQARTAVRCNADATFRIKGVPRGSGDLLLLIDGKSPARANVLARMPLVLQGDVENLQLTRDPTSLPETATENR